MSGSLRWVFLSGICFTVRGAAAMVIVALCRTARNQLRAACYRPGIQSSNSIPPIAFFRAGWWCKLLVTVPARIRPRRKFTLNELIFFLQHVICPSPGVGVMSLSLTRELF
jgi:hypothetical protein